MADDKPVTPEQQLLKLIEGGKGAAPSSTPSKLKKLPGSFLGRLSFIRRSGKKKSASPRRAATNIGDINRMLYVAVACLLVYVVFDAAASAANLRRPPNFVPPKDMKTAFTKDTIASLQETSYYLQKVSSRDIFKEGKKMEAQTAKPVENTVVEPSEAIKNLALVGISWSTNPDAIIEDKAHQRTFFVKRGQMVGDNVKVEAIFKDHVVVTNEDHEFELR